jgi:hypothetical protein
MTEAAGSAVDADGEPPPDRRIRASTFTVVDPRDIPQREWLYGKHLVRRYVSVTGAPGGAGKSSLEIAEAVGMAAGRDLFAGTTIKPLRVWIYQLEDDMDELQRRIAAVMRHHGISAEDIGDRLFVDSGRNQQLVLAEQSRDGAVIARPVVEAVVGEIEERQIDCMIVDPFVSSHRLEENDNGAMDALVKTWADIADRGRCAIELVHHVRKMGQMEIDAESLRGGKALVDAARSVRIINRMQKHEADWAGVPPDARWRYFRVENGKGNFAPPEAAEWRRMASHWLPNGPGSESGDSVGVVEAWTWPSAFDGVTAEDLDRVKNRIKAGHWRKDPRAKHWAGEAVAEVLGLELENRMERAKVAKLLKNWIANGALVVVDGRDERRKPVQLVEVAPDA